MDWDGDRKIFMGTRIRIKLLGCSRDGENHGNGSRASRDGG